jgi:hypothetical protein
VHAIRIVSLDSLGSTRCAHPLEHDPCGELAQERSCAEDTKARTEAPDETNENTDDCSVRDCAA